MVYLVWVERLTAAIFVHHTGVWPSYGTHASEFDRERSEDTMKRITTAYRVLIDKSSREQYDTTANEDTDEDMGSPFDAMPLPYRERDSAKFEQQMKSWEREVDKASLLNPHPLGKTKEGDKLRGDVSGLLSTRFEEIGNQAGAARQVTSWCTKFDTSQSKGTLSSSTSGKETIGRRERLVLRETATAIESESESKRLKEHLQYVRFVAEVVNSLKNEEGLGSDLPSCDSYKKEMEGEVRQSGRSCTRVPEVSAGSRVSYSTVAARTLEFPHCIVSSPPLWIPDSERANCVGCSVKFIPMYIRRKHHCRSCGDVYCKACTPHWIPLRKYGFTNPVRVCRRCFQSHVSDYVENWLERARTLVKDGDRLQSWASFLLAVELQSPSDKPQLILKAVQEFQHSGKPEWAVLWSAQLLSRVPVNSSASLKMHKAVAAYLYRCAMDATKTEACLHLLFTALGAEYCMQDIANHATPRLDYLSDVEQKIRKEVRRTQDGEEQSRKRLVEDGVAALTAALTSFDMNLFASRVSESDEEVIVAFIKRAKLSTDTENSWHLLALTLCHMRMQAADWQTLSTLDVRIWSGIGKAQHEQVVSWAVDIAIGIIEAGGWSWVQQARARAVTSSAVSMAASDLPEPPSAQYFKSMSVKGLKIRHIRRYEIAVEKKPANKEWDARRAALAYIDLLPSCEHPSQIAMCCVTIAMWLLKSMKAAVEGTVSLDKTAKLQTKNVRVKQLGNIYSLQKGVCEWVNQALIISELFLHPAMRLHIAQQSFRCITAACLLAGVKDLPDGLEQSLDGVIRLTRLFPVSDASCKWSSILVSEAVLFDLLVRDLHDPFLSDVQLVDPKILLPAVKQSQLYYQLYETGMSGFGSLEARVRKVAMDELLKEKGWSWENAEALMNSPIIPRDSAGWLKQGPRSLGEMVSRAFNKILGLAVHKKNNELKLLARASSKESGLVTVDDFAAAVQAHSEGFGAVFSLDPPDGGEMRYHPFQKMVYEPRSLEGTELLHTLFHTDYLLKQFSTGVEVNQTPPFKQRASQLTSGLSRKLQTVLQPVHERPASRSLSHIHRFWIQATQMEYNIKEDEDYVFYLVGDVAMEIRCRPMMPNVDGDLQDIADEEDNETGEYKFAADFTKHYDDIGRAFPEFLRLKELCKLLWLGHVAGSHGKMLEQASSPTIPQELVEMNFDANRKNCVQNVSQMLTKMEKHLPGPYSYDCERQRTTVRGQMSTHLRVAVDRFLFDNWFDNPAVNSRAALAASIGTSLTPSRSRIRQILEEEARRTFTQYEKQYKRNLSQLKAQYKKKEEVGDCTWVPAAHHRFTVADGVTRQVYGGVILCPKMCDASLTKPSTKSHAYPLHSTNNQPQVKHTDTSQCLRTLLKYRPKCQGLPAVDGDGAAAGGSGGSAGGSGRNGGRSGSSGNGAGDGSNGSGDGSNGSGDGSDGKGGGSKVNHDPRYTDTEYQWTLQDALLLRPCPLQDQNRLSFLDQTFRMVESNGCYLARLYGFTQKGSKYGLYWIFDSKDVFPGSESLQHELAILPNWNDMLLRTVIYLPKGFNFFIGKTAPQGPFRGGGEQIVLPSREIVYHLTNMCAAAAERNLERMTKDMIEAFEAQDRFFRSFNKELKHVFRQNPHFYNIQHFKSEYLKELLTSHFFVPSGGSKPAIVPAEKLDPEVFQKKIIRRWITADDLRERRK